MAAPGTPVSGPSGTEASPSPDRSATSTSGALFRERLVPGPGTWLVLLGFGLSFGIVLLPLSLWAAIAVGVLGMAAMVAVGVFTSPVIAVEGTELLAGRARIDVEHLGEVAVLDREAWATAMSTGFRPEDHHCTRGWVPTGIRVELTDPEDPTPAWQLSSRRPEDLALALQAAGRRG